MTEPADPASVPVPVPGPEHAVVRKPRTVGGVVYLGVLLATLTGLVVVVAGAWRTGLTLMGLAFLAGAVGRLVLSDAAAGMLGIRRKFVDVTSMTVIGAGLVALAAVIPSSGGTG